MSGEPTSIPAGFTPDLVSGNIAGMSAMPRPILDTLDEPVSATLVCFLYVLDFFTLLFPLFLINISVFSFLSFFLLLRF